MKLAIAYSHADIHMAFRLLVWIARLGKIKHPLLVMASQRASRLPRHQDIAALLKEEFPNHQHLVCKTENEKGWPDSATHLFGETIEAADDDIFWLEPDCVPMYTGWFDDLVKEYRKAGKTFMGALVPHVPGRCPTHMSGVAFYGKNWRAVAPLLPVIQHGPGKMGAWDVDCCDEVLADFQATELVQHSWKRFDKDRGVRLDAVNPGTAVYHQCKDGELFVQIDPEFYFAPLTRKWLPVTTGNIMTHYFLSKSTKSPVQLGGRKFQFEPCEFSTNTNSWWGVIKVSEPAEVDLLKSFAEQRRISEITAEDYQRWISKKNNGNRLITSVPLQSPLDDPSLARVAEPAVAPQPPKPAVALDAVITASKPVAPRSKR
jgi:hypothetical protein